MQNLIIVGGHAIFHGKNSLDIFCDTNWFLYEFQKGEPRLYVEHIKAGVIEASKDEESLLIFSGGQTRKSVGPISESQSYWTIADLCSWWGNPEVKSRATTEEFARDSFENLIFSICRFYECTNRFPENITVIGWGFKKERYIFHCKTIKFPLKKFKHIAVNNPVDLRRAIEGERINCQIPYKNDPFGATKLNKSLSCGSHGACVVTKKNERNPFKRTPPYKISCPELTTLIEQSNPCLPDKLPWGVADWSYSQQLDEVS